MPFLDPTDRLAFEQFVFRSSGIGRLRHGRHYKPAVRQQGNRIRPGALRSDHTPDPGKSRPALRKIDLEDFHRLPAAMIDGQYDQARPTWLGPAPAHAVQTSANRAERSPDRSLGRAGWRFRTAAPQRRFLSRCRTDADSSRGHLVGEAAADHPFRVRHQDRSSYIRYAANEIDAIVWTEQSPSGTVFMDAG